MDRIGLIGIGNIGRFYAQRLIEEGYSLTALDLDPERVRYAVELGAQAAASPAEVAERSDVVILSLPGSRAVEAVMDGEEGVLSCLRAGQLVIDTGTTRPETDARYERLCAAKGAGFVDAPLTWRGPGQIIMVGGTAESYSRAEPLLSKLSYKLRHVGPIGEGQVLKLINQAIQAGQLAVYAEAVELAKRQGVDPCLLKEYLEYNVPEVLFDDDFTGGGHLALHYKDLGYLLEVAHDSGANIPITSLVHEVFKASKLYGDPNWLQAGIASYWRRMNEGDQKGSPHPAARRHGSRLGQCKHNPGAVPFRRGGL